MTHKTCYGELIRNMMTKSAVNTINNNRIMRNVRRKAQHVTDIAFLPKQNIYVVELMLGHRIKSGIVSIATIMSIHPVA